MRTQQVRTEVRDVMDQLTLTVFGPHKDLGSIGDCYTEDALLVSPDQGEAQGREQIVEYWRHFVTAFPDSRYVATHRYEVGDTAIDEGLFTGTNSAPMPMPSGQALPPTGNTVRIRSCDIATVANGRIAEHHIYFDQLSFLAQLGILGERPG